MISEIFNGGFFSKSLGYGQSSLGHFKASDFGAGKAPSFTDYETEAQATQ